MPCLLELENIRKTRRSGNVVFQLRIPEFRVEYGEFVAVVGPSGCGKSTFLDVVALVLRPDENKRSVFRFNPRSASASGKDINACWRGGREDTIAAMRRSHIGYVLQTGGLLGFLSVARNIGLSCRLNGIDHIDEEVNRLATKLDIADQLRKKPRFLSGGQRQRVAIARAVVHRPAIVLADEPTAAVDSERAKIIVREFKQLAMERHSAIIMVTHDRQLVRPFADREMMFRLESGKLKNVEYTISTMVPLKGSA